MIWRQPRFNPTAKLFSETTLFRSFGGPGDHSGANLAQSYDAGPHCGVRTRGSIDVSRRCGSPGASWCGLATCPRGGDLVDLVRSEEHTSELQSLMRISYAVLCLKKKTNTTQKT